MKLKEKIKEMSRNRKGQVFQQLAGVAVGVLVFAVVLTITFLIIAQGLSQVGSIEGVDSANKNLTECGSSVTCNATTQLQSAVSGIADWVPLFILVSVGIILLGAAFAILAFARKRR